MRVLSFWLEGADAQRTLIKKNTGTSHDYLNKYSAGEKTPGNCTLFNMGKKGFNQTGTSNLKLKLLTSKL